jgi:hypothetical protein
VSRGTSLVALASLFVVACSGDRRAHDAGVIEGPLRTKQLPKANDPIAAPKTLPMPREVKQTVEDRGAEPRARLRYGLATDADRKVMVTVEVTSRTLRDGAWSEPIALPRMRHGVAVRGDGARLLVRALPIEIDPDATTEALQLAAAQADRWRLIAGRRTTVSADLRGRISAVAFADTPADTGAPSPEPAPARDELWQWLLGAMVPLPDEAVGVGATWTVKSVIRIGTATVEQIGTYRLLAADARTLTIEVEVRRIGEPQSTDATGLPAGSVAELIALLRETRGTLVVSTADGLPVSGTLDVEVRVHARFHVPGQPKMDVASEDRGTLTFGSE